MHSSTEPHAFARIQKVWDTFVQGTPGATDGGKFFHFVNDVGLRYITETDPRFQKWTEAFADTGTSDPEFLGRDDDFLGQSSTLVGERGGAATRVVIVNVETVGMRGGAEHWMLDGLAQTNGHPEVGKEDVRVVFEKTARSHVETASTPKLDQGLLQTEFGVFQSPSGRTTVVHTHIQRDETGAPKLELTFYEDDKPGDLEEVQKAVDFMEAITALNFVRPGVMVNLIETERVEQPTGLQSQGPEQYLV